MIGQESNLIEQVDDVFIYMNTSDKIQAFLEAAAECPAKSKLEPYAELIRTLRRKRWTYRQIAAALKNDFGVHAAPSSIHNFVKVRARKSKTVSEEQSMIVLEPKTHPVQKRPRFNIDA